MSPIPVLCYHYFGHDRTFQPGIKNEDCAYITPIDEFQKGLHRLRETGYTFGLLNIGAGVTENCCVITIDDAHLSVMNFAAPVLEKMNIPAVLFVVPEWVGRDGYMSWTEIRKLADSGWQIGSHGLTHRLLPVLGDSDVQHELTESAAIIRRKLSLSGSKESALMPLAVPIGGISTRIESLARQAGYDYIASSRYGRWDGKPDKAIPRIVLKEPYDRADAIRDILNGWSMKGIELRLRSLVKQGRNFAAEWKR